MSIYPNTENTEQAILSTVQLPEPTIGKHERSLPAQQPFTSHIRNIFLLPISKELENQHLAVLLSQLMNQSTENSEAVGLIVLIDEKSNEIPSKPEEPKTEKELTADFLTALITQDLATIQSLPIPVVYKSLGEQIIESKKLEVRFDFLSQVPYGHKYSRLDWGKIRLHLLGLAKAFSNPSVPQNTVIAHFTDVDTLYEQNHIRKVGQAYKEPETKWNISGYDMYPGVHEGIKQEDISREMLLSIDEYRFFRYVGFFGSLLFRSLKSGSATISGRLSEFENKKIKEILLSTKINEDWELASFLFQAQHQYLSNRGEVYFSDRARSTDDYIGSDAEFRYMHNKGKNRNILGPHSNLLKLINIGAEKAYAELPLPGFSYFLALRDLIDNDEPFDEGVKNMIRMVLISDIPELKQFIEATELADQSSVEEIYKQIWQHIRRWNHLAERDPDEFGDNPNAEKLFIRTALTLVLTNYTKLQGAALEFLMPEDSEKYLQYAQGVVDSISPNFRQTKEWQKLFQAARRREFAKVQLRTRHLMQGLIAQRDSTVVSFSSRSIIEPYIQYLQDELRAITDEVDIHEPNGVRKVANIIQASYPQMFSLSEPVHQQIIELRSLIKYVVESGLNLEHPHSS
jgi:hypothetical protein